MTPSTRSVHIERLELDLRGVPVAIAEAAIRQLQPELQRALASDTAEPSRIRSNMTPTELARAIAAQVTCSIDRETSPEQPSIEHP